MALLLLSFFFRWSDVLTLCPGHPFDLAKTRLQTAAPGQYTGMVDVMKKTLARDGIKGYVYVD